MTHALTKLACGWRPGTAAGIPTENGLRQAISDGTDERGRP